MPHYVDGTEDVAAGVGDGPLLQHDNTTSQHRRYGGGSASVLSCSINLTNTILGSGMLAMAAGVAALGLAGGVLLILLSACASALGLYYLTRVAAEIPLLAPAAPRVGNPRLRRKQREHASFYACAYATYPRMATLINLAIAVKCFGVGISYLIIIGDLMPEVLEGLGWNLRTIGIFADRRVWITLGMLVVGPLSFLRKLDSLRHTSLVALTAVVYLVMVVVWSFFWVNAGNVAQGVVWWRWNVSGLLRSLPVFVFAFTCHQNIFAVYNELKDRNQVRLNRVIGNAVGTAFVVYVILGVLGYLTFGPQVLPNIIMMYQSGLVVLLGRELLVLLQLFSFPLQCHPCRACLEQILPSSQAPSPPGSGDHSTLLPRQYAPIERSERAISDEGRIGSDSEPDTEIEVATNYASNGELLRHQPSAVMRRETTLTTSLRSHTILTSTILLLSYVVAISVTKLDVVLAFVGATGSTTISFILPGAFYYGLHRDQPWYWRKIVAVILAIFGTIMMIVCLGANIVNLIESQRGGGHGERHRDGPGGM